MKKYSVIGVFVIIIGLVAVFYWLNQPNNGNVSRKLNNDVLSASKSTLNLQTNRFSTVYDNTLLIKSSNENNDGPIFSQHLLSSKIDGDDSQVGITVADMDGDINEVSPAKFRLLDPGQYQQSSLPFAPVGSLIFIKNTVTKYEITVIWGNENYYSAVVGSGTSTNKENIQELVSDVVSNWQWKN